MDQGENMDQSIKYGPAGSLAHGQQADHVDLENYKCIHTSIMCNFYDTDMNAVLLQISLHLIHSSPLGSLVSTDHLH